MEWSWPKIRHLEVLFTDVMMKLIISAIRVNIATDDKLNVGGMS